MAVLTSIVLSLILGTVPATGNHAAPEMAVVATVMGTQQASAPPATGPEQPLHIGGSVVPPKLIKAPSLKFPRSVRKQTVNGIVRILLWVERDGSPSHVSVAKSLRPDLDELAVEAVRKYRFRPATQQGAPVLVSLYVDVNIAIQ